MWVSEEPKWRQEWAESVAASANPGAAKRVRQTEHPQVTEMLELWVAKATAENVLLNGGVIRQKWTNFADLLGIPESERLHLSDGWLSKFKERVGLKDIRGHGEAASSQPTLVASAFVTASSHLSPPRLPWDVSSSRTLAYKLALFLCTSPPRCALPAAWRFSCNKFLLPSLSVIHQQRTAKKKQE